MGKTKTLLKKVLKDVQEPQWYFQWCNTDGLVRSYTVFCASQKQAIKRFKEKFPNVENYIISCV